MGLDPLDLVRIHEGALSRLLGPVSGHDGMLRRTEGFLVQALRPMVRSDGHERRLEREVRRREAVQRALDRSERHHGQLLEKSRLMQEHLRRLSHDILSAHEEERRKISRELHDEIGQILTAVNVKLATLKKEAAVSTTDLTRKIDSTQRLVERSMNTVHRFARELRPPLLDDLGLIPALHAYLKAFTKRTHIPVHFKTAAALEGLDSDKRTVLYRVAQEALTNVAKHAKASRVEVSVQRGRGVVTMEVHDDGKSFQVERVLLAKKIRRLGLLGMRERVEMVGGVFAVESVKGEGTTIRAQVPLGRGRK
jgi:signal transduction histidine kinase